MVQITLLESRNPDTFPSRDSTESHLVKHWNTEVTVTCVCRLWAFQLLICTGDPCHYRYYWGESDGTGSGSMVTLPCTSQAVIRQHLLFTAKWHPRQCPASGVLLHVFPCRRPVTGLRAYCNARAGWWVVEDHCVCMCLAFQTDLGLPGFHLMPKVATALVTSRPISFSPCHTGRLHFPAPLEVSGAM